MKFSNTTPRYLKVVTLDISFTGVSSNEVFFAPCLGSGGRESEIFTFVVSIVYIQELTPVIRSIFLPILETVVLLIGFVIVHCQLLLLTFKLFLKCTCSKSISFLFQRHGVQIRTITTPRQVVAANKTFVIKRTAI